MTDKHCGSCTCNTIPAHVADFLLDELAPATPTSGIPTGDLWVTYIHWINRDNNFPDTGSLTQVKLTRAVRALGYDIANLGKGNELLGYRLVHPRRQQPS
jgi:hypothetical protein